MAHQRDFFKVKEMKEKVQVELADRELRLADERRQQEAEKGAVLQQQQCAPWLPYHSLSPLSSLGRPRHLAQLLCTFISGHRIATVPVSLFSTLPPMARLPETPSEPSTDHVLSISTFQRPQQLTSYTCGGALASSPTAEAFPPTWERVVCNSGRLPLPSCHD